MASAEPCSTEVKDCTLKDGLVMFSWKPADGAKEYQLEVKDEFQKHSIIQKNKLTSHEFSIELDEKLRVGKTYMVRVTVVGLDEQLKSTDWKLQIIGGEDVPQNVTATVNQENPYRVANIQFDHPKCAERPHSYVILAVPATGKREKETFTSANDIKFKYLRSGVKYKFLVQACYKDKKSELACSNFVITHQKNKSKYGAVNASNVSGTTIHAEGATAYNIKNVLNISDENFGQVINLLTQVKNFSGNKDVVSIYWDSPSFNNCQDDYRVWSYDISIRNISGNEVDNKVINFVDGQYDYKVESIKLDLGYTYTIYVKTFYKNIDEDKNQKSSAVKKSLDTRPCSPESLKSWWEISEIIVEWNSARGAVQYEVQIYKEGIKDPVFTNTQNKTLWSHRFTDDLGFGSSYKAVVSAISVEGLCNESQTEYQIIGGDHVPRNASATIWGVTDPNTEALVKWLEPEKKPLSYKVTAITDTTNKWLSTKACKTNSFIYTELKPGMDYRFIVTAIHADFKSGGCKSNKVKTDPKPTPVKNVVLVSSSPTSISLKWDQVDSENERESTEYKVKIVAKDINQKHKLTVTTEKCTVDRLQPGIWYRVIIAGGNSEGFGRYSEPVEVRTKLGKPKKVLLKCLADSSSKSLLVSFQNAEGHPDHYTLNLHKINQKSLRKLLVVPVQQTSEEYQFQNLEANTQYICGVKASYNNEDGEEIETNWCYTAPAKAEILYANVKKLSDEGEFSSNEVEVKWDQIEGCQQHEVRFKTLEENIENTLSVSNNNSCHYSCEHEGSIYIVQVRSKNQSGYGEWSDSKIIYLAPPAIRDIIVRREDDHFRMTWSKPAHYLRLDGFSIKVNDEEIFLSSNKLEFIYNPMSPATSYTFGISGFITLNTKKIKGRFSLSNQIESKPSQTKITELKICGKNSSSKISISWEKSEKCDMYEIIVSSNSLGKVETIMRQESNLPEQCWYICQRPGDSYSVAIRCVYLSVSGNGSESKTIQLVPEKVTITRTDFDDRSLQVYWDSLLITHLQYKVLLFEDGEKLEEKRTRHTACSFSPLKPGRRYYCTVVAINNAGSGEEAVTKEYKCAWTRPQELNCTLDDDNPSIIAKISWEKPHGVDLFKLVISGVLEIFLKDTSYTFKQGNPNHVYNISLYCGCDGYYDTDCVSATLVMAPLPPRNIKAGPGKNDPESTLIVTYDDAQCPSKIYEIVAKSQSGGNPIKTQTRDHSALLIGLTPGDSYIIAVRSLSVTNQNLQSQEAFIVEAVQTGSAKAEPAHSYSQSENSAGERKLSSTHWHLGPEQTKTNNLEDLLVKASYNPRNRVKPSMEVYYGLLEGVDTEKIVVKMMMFEKKEKEKLTREVRNLKTLHHENVVKYIFSNFCNRDEKFESAFIIMEECDERTLYDRVLRADTKPSFDYNETRRHVNGLCDGLQHIHDSNIIHRDIKPQNILFRNRKVNGDMIETVVISDFGLSKMLRDGNTSTQLSSTSRGTNGWRAPETYKWGKISKKADIFSLGLVVYHMLSNGQHAYGDNPDLWSGNICDDKKKNLEHLCEFCGRELALDLIESMLRTDPAKRPCIEQVQQHPFFWNSKQKLNFYGDLIKYMEFVGKKSVHRPKKVKHDQSCTKQATGCTGQTKSFGERANDQKSQTAGHQGETKNHPERPLSQSGSPPNQTTIKQAEDQNKDIEIPFLDLDEGDTSEWLKALRYKNPDTKKEENITDWNKCFIFTPQELEAMQKSCQKRGIKEEVEIDAMQAKATMFQKLPAINMKELSFDSTKEPSAEPTEGCNPSRNNSPVYTLLNFIRNRHTHLLEDSRNNHFHLTEEELWDFFSSRFPNFFQYVYKRFQEHYTNKQKSDKDFTTLINKYFTFDKWNICDESPDE